MKKINYLLLLLFSANLIYSQQTIELEHVADVPNFPFGMTVDKGNGDIYVYNAVDFNLTPSSILRLDNTSSTPTFLPFVDEVVTLEMQVEDNVFYYNNFLNNGSSITSLDLFKVDLDDPDLTSVKLIDGTVPGLPLGPVHDFYVDGNVLYLLAFNDADEFSIHTADLNSSTLPLEITELVSLGADNEVGEIIVHEGFIYIASTEEVDPETVYNIKIHKIDIANPNPTLIFNLKINSEEPFIRGLFTYNNDIYIGDSFGRLLKKELSSTDPSDFEWITDNLEPPIKLEPRGSEVFVALLPFTEPSSVAKFDLENILSLEDVTKAPRMKLFPNPSSDIISISGVTNSSKYTIYSVLGSKITTGNLSKDNKVINIKNLHNGTYFIKFDDGRMEKFVKK